VSVLEFFLAVTWILWVCLIIVCGGLYSLIY
jgi:hypothetical protein